MITLTDIIADRIERAWARFDRAEISWDEFLDLCDRYNSGRDGGVLA